MKKNTKLMPKPRPLPYVYPIGSINIQLDGIPEVKSKEKDPTLNKLESKYQSTRKINESAGGGGSVCCIICTTAICVTVFGLITALAVVLTIVLGTTTTTANTSELTSSLSSSSTSSLTSSSTSQTSPILPSAGSTNPTNSVSTTSVTTINVASTTSICPSMTCSFTAIAAPMTPYHGVEHLDINCTTSVSKMLIQITVERTVGATFASQYNTFWSSTTNESYLQNSTHIIYTWTILAGQIVSGSGFPYFVEGQYSLPNVNQTTSHDTYSAQLTSVCGNTVTSSGKF